MMEQKLYMPFRIMVVGSYPFPGANAMYYTKDGEPYHAVTDVPDVLLCGAVPFTDELYCELLSVSTPEQAKAFMAVHPDLRVFYLPNHAVPDPLPREYLTEKQYCQRMLSALELYRDLRHYWLDQQQYKEDHDEALLPEMRAFYRKHFSLLNPCKSWRSYEDMTEALFQTYYSGEDDREETDDEALYEAQMREVWRMIDSDRDNQMVDSVSRFLGHIIGSATIRMNPEDMTLEYRCADLLTAMYMMLFTAAQNRHEYRQCAHPKCGQYFRVDPSHPQSRCPKHMQARRTKRQNQRKREKERNAQLPDLTND